MVSNKPSEHPPKVGIIHKDIKEPSALLHMECLETAFFRISSAISAHKDLNTILEVIGRESLNCLNANRSTIFFMDPKTGILSTQFTHSLDPEDERMGLFEEMEVAQKTIQQNKPFVAGEREIISLMGVPISFKGKTMGVLSLVLIDKEYGFDEKCLQFFSSFANLASAAMEMVDLLETTQDGKNLRLVYQRYVDNLLNQLQNSAEKESPRSESHAVKIQAEQKVEKEKFHEGPSKEKVAGVHGTKPLKEESGTDIVHDRLPSPAKKQSPRSESHAVKKQAEQKVEKENFHEAPSKESVPWVQGRIITLEEESGIERRKDERVDAIVRVEFQEEFWGFTKDLSRGGAFILTPDPAELGDQFVMKLHMQDSGEPIEVTCKVVWTNKYGKETQDLRRGMGVKFLSLQPEIKKRIETYIESRKNKPPRLKN